MRPTQKELENIAYEIRRLSLISTTYAGSGHPTSCLSAADILAVLFFDIMKENDHFILSKGHAAPALYAVYHLLGCISEKELFTLRKFDSALEGHPTPRFPYVQVATGSLGQGLSIGVGQILAERLKKTKNRCFVLMGDSETTEGSVWEAVELASYYKLSNLVALIDANGLGQTTRTISSLETYKKKFESFGWNALITQGNSVPQLQTTLKSIGYADKPTCIISHTLKGYGVPSVQDREDFHGKAFRKEEIESVLKELKVFFPDASSSKSGEFKSDISCETIPKNNFKHISFEKPHFKKGERLATRKSFGVALEYAGTVSQSIVSLDAEVNNSTFSNLFADRFPDRFFQSFIAEQNMIGMAAGLATQGLIAFSSTFASFTSRAYDQLRMSAISRLPLRVVGSHAGVSIGQDGPSQMGLEDIALFRTLPESIVLYPCDAVSTYRCVELMTNHHTSISYLRTTREVTPIIYDNSAEFKIGGCHMVQQAEGDVATIVAAGITVFEALKAAKVMPATVIDCYSIKPLPIAAIITQAERTNYTIIVVEDHYEAGGLGEAVITAVTQYAPGKPWRIKHLCVRKLPLSGEPEELLAYEDIDAAAIIRALRNF